MKIIKQQEVQLRSGWSQRESSCMLSVSTKTVEGFLLLLLGYRFEWSFNVEFNYRGKVQHLSREWFQRCTYIDRRSRKINANRWAVGNLGSVYQKRPGWAEAPETVRIPLLPVLLHIDTDTQTHRHKDGHAWGCACALLCLPMSSYSSGLQW